MKKLSRVVLLLLFVALQSGCTDTQTATLPVKGEAMPSFSMLNLSEKSDSSQDLFEDKVVVLNIWATWCPPCRQEMPDLIRLSEMLPKDKFVVIGLAADNNIEVVQQFVKEHHISFPIYWDKAGNSIVAKTLGVARFPETFVINRKGVYVEKIVGAFPWADPQMLTILNGIYETGHIPEEGSQGGKS